MGSQEMPAVFGAWGKANCGVCVCVCVCVCVKICVITGVEVCVKL